MFMERISEVSAQNEASLQEKLIHFFESAVCFCRSERFIHRTSRKRRLPCCSRSSKKPFRSSSITPMRFPT